MGIEIWKVFAGFGVPGLALGVFYLIFKKINIDLPKIPRNWAGPIAILFILVVGTIVTIALLAFVPKNPLLPISSGKNIKLIERQLTPVYFDTVENESSENKSNVNTYPTIYDDEDCFHDESGRMTCLKDSEINRLKRHAILINKLPEGVIVLIEGFSSRLNPFVNPIVTHHRATYVRKTLVDFGVNPKVLEISSLGGSFSFGHIPDLYDEKVEFKLFY